MTSASSLDEVEARIALALLPYREELEEALVYGIPALRWPGANAHECFVSWQRSTTKVSIYAVGLNAWPMVLEGSSERMRKARTGKATLSFPQLDEALAGELDDFLARLYSQYRSRHAGR